MIFVWVVIAVALLFFEMHHLAFFALFGAVGAIAAAIVAALAPDAVGIQVAVAIIVAVIGVIAARPYVSRAFEHRRHSGKVAHGVHGGLVGEQAITLDAVGDAHDVGHVRLAGERWLATSEAGRIPAGTKVLVMGVRGTTLLVWPVDGDGFPELGPADGGAGGGAADGSDQ
jgi:membrane protein implicated in regulation of membrane protease activity